METNTWQVHAKTIVGEKSEPKIRFLAIRKPYGGEIIRPYKCVMVEAEINAVKYRENPLQSARELQKTMASNIHVRLAPHLAVYVYRHGNNTRHPETRPYNTMGEGNRPRSALGTWRRSQYTSCRACNVLTSKSAPVCLFSRTLFETRISFY